MKYIKRALEDAVCRVSKTFPVLLLTGPRQAGKTTLLQKLSEKERQYVTLDDPGIRYLAINDPALFMMRYKPPILIDEIQYAPELLPYVKMAVDKSKNRGDFWLTGSQMFHLMKNVSESLAGRVGIVNLLGLSGSEINVYPSVPFSTEPDSLLLRSKQVPKLGLVDVYERIFKGSMPALYENSEINPTVYYQSYMNTYLQRDIKDLTQVADEMSFYNFMTVVAARTSRPISYSEIAKEAGISAPTAKKWLSILVSSNIVALVQPYHNNVLKRVVKQPQMHFLDTGLCAYLLKWSNPDVLEKGAMSGAFFESHVFSEIYKSFLNDGKEPPLFYYRDRDKKEIDLLIYQNGTLYPIEIKKTASCGKASIKNFNIINPVSDPEKFGELDQMKVKIGNGAVICMTGEMLPIDAKNWAVPAWVI